MLEFIKLYTPILTAIAGTVGVMKVVPTTARQVKRWIQNWRRNGILSRQDRIKRLDLYREDAQMLRAEIYRYKTAATWVYSSLILLLLSVLIPGHYSTREVWWIVCELLVLLILGYAILQQAAHISIMHGNPNKTRARLQLELKLIELKNQLRTLEQHKGIVAPTDIGPVQNFV